MREAPKRKRLWLSTLMVLMLLGAACGQKADDTSTGGSAATDEGDTIKVGLLHSLSGTMAII